MVATVVAQRAFLGRQSLGSVMIMCEPVALQNDHQESQYLWVFFLLLVSAVWFTASTGQQGK